MPGIYGVTAHNQQSDPSNIAREMKKLMHHRSFYKSLEHQHENTCIGALSTNPCFTHKNRLATNGMVTLLVEGTAFVLDNTAIADDSNDLAQKLLSLYLNYGEQFIHHVGGYFNLVILDHTHETLHLFNDRMGFAHMYWHVDNEVLMFGPELKAFLAWSKFDKSVNMGALATTLAQECPYGSETLFQSVSMLEPASQLSYKHGKVTVKSYWKASPKGIKRSADEVIDEALVLYKRSIDKRIPSSSKERVILPLSGGLDSRLLLSLSKDFQDRLDIFTHGQEDCTDYKFGKLIAKAADVEKQHRLIEMNPDWAGSRAREAVWLNDGQLNMRNATLLGIGSQVGEGAEPFLNGIIGHHMSIGVGGFAGPSDLVSIKNKSSFNKEMLAFTQIEQATGSFNQFCTPDVIKDMTSASLNHVQQSFQPLRHIELLGDQKAIHACDNMGRRMQGTVDVNKFMFHDLTPYVDDELKQFWLSIPLEMRFGRELYIELFRRKIPELAQVPWSHTGHNLYANAEDNSASIKKRMSTYEINKKITRLSLGMLSPKNKNAYNHRETWLRKNPVFQGLVKETLAGAGNNSLGIFDQQQINSLFTRFLYGRDYLFKPVMQVASILIWHDQFIDNPCTRGEQLIPLQRTQTAHSLPFMNAHSNNPSLRLF